MKMKFFLLVCVMTCSSVMFTQASDKKVIDLGQLEIEGELRRPNTQWLDSQKRLREYLLRMYAEQFQKLENELLRPMTHPEFDVELQKEEHLVSN